MVDFFEKCWTTKMEVFHMMFEKTDDNNNHIEYQNIEGVIPFCEYIGFDKLEENTNKSEEENYTFINYCGEIIWSGKNIENHDFSYLSTGVYFLKVNNKTIKLIKQ